MRSQASKLLAAIEHIVGFYNSVRLDSKLGNIPRHAGHHYGMTVVRRRRARVWRLSQTGIWQTKHRPITSTISARLGEFAMGRDDCAGVGLCSEAARCVVCDALVQILGNSDCHLRGKPVFSGRFRTVYGAILGLMRLNFLSVAPHIVVFRHCLDRQISAGF